MPLLTHEPQTVTNDVPLNGTVQWERRRRPRDFSGLLEQLGDAKPATRRWAARDLSSYKESAEHLLRSCKDETDPSVREAIFTSLITIGTDTVVEGLIELLRHPDPALRNEAVEALGQLPDKFAQRVQRLLRDPDPDVRILTINVLQAYPKTELEEWLVQIVDSDWDPNVCATAVDLLSEVGSARSVPALERLKERFADEPYLVYVADLAIQRIRGE